MLILGISALDNNSCATLLDGDRIVAAVAEERLSRVKMQNGFPRRAIDEVLRIAGRKPHEVEAVAYPFFEWEKEAQQIGRAYARNVVDNARTDTPLASRVRHQLRFSEWAARAVWDHRKFNAELDEGLAALGLGGERGQEVLGQGHHRPHALHDELADALPHPFGYADGFGDDLSTVTGCDELLGYVLIGGDCDDANPDVRPGAIETCDLVDNDCSGTVDDNVTDVIFVIVVVDNN
jgi:hypothetical protein